MNDSGLWKRGIFLLILVGVIAGVALFVALRRPGTPEASQAEPICPELLSHMLVNPGAPLPAGVNWGVVYQVGQTCPSPKGWEVRYNAALTLARKGHPDLPFDTIREMMDEQQQLKNFSVCLKNGKLMADDGAARRTILNALETFVQWHKHPGRAKKFDAHNADLQKVYEAELQQVYQAVAQLAQNPNNVLSTEAKKALQSLGR